MILRNHGLLALGETVREAFELMYYLDCACQIQIDALAGGLENVQLMSEQAARHGHRAVRAPRPAVAAQGLAGAAAPARPQGDRLPGLARTEARAAGNRREEPPGEMVEAP